MNRGRAGVLAAVIASCAGALVGVPAGAALAAPPPGACVTEPPQQPVRAQRPWENKLLDPARVWSVTRGAGVRVGVVDSGVDSDNPHLRGKVFPGFDFVRDEAGGRFDCAAHGTPVASIIAGARLEDTGFHGMAPDVRVVPARVADTTEIEDGPAVVADGIRYVVDNGASVVNLSLTLFEDSPRVRDAVDYAQEQDVLVVAAAGNLRNEGNLTPYPAAYPGVLGVGSIDATGARARDSQSGDYVDLVAPGVRVTGCAPGAGHALFEGTSFAAPFVTGAAALVRSARPELSADQVADRLIRTASVSRGGRRGPDYGAGLVNPYRAVTDTTVSGAPKAAELTPVRGQRTDPAAQRRAAAERAVNQSARGTATTLLVVTVGGLAVAGIVLAGRRRGWAPTRRADISTTGTTGTAGMPRRG